MRALAHQQVSEAVTTMLAETPPPKACGSLIGLQLSLIQKANEPHPNKDLVTAAIKDAWFLGFWSLRAGIQLTDESARNLVIPASVLQDGFWRNTKKELSTATGVINPAFMDLSPVMVDLDPTTGTAAYNVHAQRIIERNLADQHKSDRVRLEEPAGCPHGITGMSRFLLQYLEFMTTHISQPEPAAAAS